MSPSQAHLELLLSDVYAHDPVAPEHLLDLRRSGLTDQSIAQAKIRTVPPADLPKLLSPTLAQKVASAYVIPYPGTDDFYRAKLFPPVADGDGHHMRYYQPLGTTPRLYVPPRAHAALGDPTVPLFITEGEKKTLKADQEGIACLGLGGLWSWLFDGKPIPDLDRVDWCDRKVVVAPDSDVWTRPDLIQAVFALGKELEERGAQVTVLKVPAADVRVKVGIDEFLVGHSKDDLVGLPQLALKHPVFSRAAKWWTIWRQRKTARTSSWSGGAGDPYDPRPRIDATDLELPRVSQAAWFALQAANNPPVLFCVGGVPSRLEADGSGLPALRPLNRERLRHHLARVASWRRGSGAEARLALPPRHVVEDMLAYSNAPLPALDRIVGAPVFAADGHLVEAPGYHAGSRIYYAPTTGLRIPPVAECPSRAEIEHASRLLLDDLLGDFPFEGDADRANALGLYLEPFVRDLIHGPTPLYVIDKPTPGTGAGLLVDALTLPSLGRPAARMTEGRDEDEWRKRVTAKFMSAPTAMLIDNVQRRLDSAALAAAITAEWWEDRLLGQTQMVRTRVRCAWIATGNNVALSSELARRSVRIRLDAKMDRPWQRRAFRHNNLRGWALEHRGDLIWAALTLVRAWIAVGRPQASTAAMLGEFEAWVSVIGGVLAIAGIPGFLLNMGEFYEAADAEGAEIRGLLQAWQQKYGEAEVGVRELFDLAVSDDVNLDLSGRTGRAQRIQLGRRLAALRDRRYQLTDDLEVRVALVGREQRANRWTLERVAPDRVREDIHPHSPDSPRSPEPPPEPGESVNVSEYENDLDRRQPGQEGGSAILGLPREALDI